MDLREGVERGNKARLGLKHIHKFKNFVNLCLYLAIYKWLHVEMLWSAQKQENIAVHR